MNWFDVFARDDRLISRGGYLAKMQSIIPRDNTKTELGAMVKVKNRRLLNVANRLRTLSVEFDAEVLTIVLT